MLDQNINRRHLSTAQRALIAAGMANAQVGDLGNGRSSANLQTYSADQAAALLNVSARTLMDAKRILASGREDLIEDIRFRMKRTVEDVIAIGKQLLRAKGLTADKACGYEGKSPDNRFAAWRADKLSDLSPKQCERCQNAALSYGSRDPVEIEGLGLSVLYELAAPNVPQITRQEIETAILSGEKITVTAHHQKQKAARANTLAASDNPITMTANRPMH